MFLSYDQFHYHQGIQEMECPFQYNLVDNSAKVSVDLGNAKQNSIKIIITIINQFYLEEPWYVNDQQ